MNEFSFFFGFLVLLYIGPCYCRNFPQYIPYVFLRLENYASGLANDHYLTIDDLMLALKEFQSWDEEVRKTIRDQQHLFRLLSDFVLIPMEKYDEIIGDDHSFLHKDYIKRMATSYKKFRPAYLGAKIDITYVKATNTDILIRSMLGMQYQEPLTKKMFDRAFIESKAIYERFEEIELHEDIFANMKELELILNFINRDEVRILKTKIFPLVHPAMDKQYISSLRDIFVNEMHKLNYFVDGDRLVQYT